MCSVPPRREAAQRYEALVKEERERWQARAERAEAEIDRVRREEAQRSEEDARAVREAATREKELALARVRGGSGRVWWGGD